MKRGLKRQNRYPRQKDRWDEVPSRVAVIVLRRWGLLPGVNENHLHNLGKLIFGFSTLWAYIWLCQYLLIYYANLPEETIYYIRRMQTPGWKTLFFLNIFLNWLIPFAILLARGAKRSPGLLLSACLIVLVGHWIDLYVLIFPTFELQPLVSLVDIAIGVGSFRSFYNPLPAVCARVP